MKKFSKILSLFVVFTMLVSMVAVVSAADEPYSLTYKIKGAADSASEVTAVKAGKDVWLDVYAPAGEYSSLSVTLGFGADTVTAGFDKAQASSTYAGAAISVQKSAQTFKVMWVSMDGSTAVTVADAPVATVKLTVPAGTAAADAVKLLKFTQFAYTLSAVGVATNGAGADVEIAVLDSFTATKATAITKSFGLGTDVLAELAKEDIEVTSEDGAKKEKGYTATWTAPADFNADKKGTYTFTGTVNQPANADDCLATFENITVTATVTIESIALTNEMVAVEIPELGIKQDEEAEAPITAAAALENAEVVEVLPTTAKISKNGAYEEEATIKWAPADASATLDLTKRTEDEATNKVAIVGTVTPAADGNYTGTATVNAEIIVVPAQIANSEIVVKSANLTTAPQVTLSVPVSEVKEANVIVVTIACGEDVKEETFEVAAADFDADETTATITLKFADKYSKLGYENGDEIAVSATLNGAALADAEGLPLAVEKTVKKPVSSGGGGNVPTSTSKPVVDEPVVDEPVVDEPVVDEPVVDEPVVDAPVADGPFADVAADNWAAPYIATLKDAGVVSGSGDGTFAPDADITRAEFTKMVVGVMGLEATATEVAFEDCTAEDWFTPYVAAAVEAGLVNGVSETEFAPNATITREQAFAIVGRAIGAEATAEVVFADAADIDEYAAPYVALLVELGIINGYEDGTIRPDANITRAEAAKILAAFVAEDEEVVEEEAAEEVVEEATEEVVEEEATEEVVDEK